MAAEEGPEWLVALYEEQGATLYRLTVLLGAEQQSARILRAAMLALFRRGHRIIDPAERVEFLQEIVVHAARTARPPQTALVLPEVEDLRQNEILTRISQLPPRMAELLVVSHYLTVFGPGLAGIMRMSLRGCNQKLEIARETLRANLGADPQPGGLDALSQEVTAALRASARTVAAPGTATLAAELEQLGGDSRFTFGPRSVSVLTALAIVVGLVIAALTTPTATPLEQPQATGVPSVAPTADRSLPAQARAIPLYYVGRQNQGLYRELRDLSSSGDLVRAAVDALLTVPPNDPDYESMWVAGQLLEVERSENATMVIDLSADAYAAIETPREAELARDQIVYTISDLVADPSLSIRFRSDGGPPPEEFSSLEGFSRDGLAPMPALWITTPRNQARFTAGDLTFMGVVKPGMGEPLVRITDVDSGRVVLEQAATASAVINLDGWRTWSVSTALPAGRYEVSARIASEVGTSTSVETKSFEVS